MFVQIDFPRWVRHVVAISVIASTPIFFRCVAQVTGNVTSRVLQIRVGGATGTSFLLEHQNVSYLVTAEHMLAGSGDKADVELLGASDHQWRTLRFRVIHGSQPCSDVAILATEDGGKIANIDPLLPASRSGLFLGQEAYFLGFPYGLVTDFGNNKAAAPFVKHAYLSSFLGCSSINPETKSDMPLILLDGMNNSGFSGGPVVAPDLTEQAHPFKLVGVISGYKNAPAEAVVDGKKVQTNILANTGLVIVIPIQTVLNLIDKDAKNRTGSSRQR